MHTSSASGGPFRWLARFALRRSGLIIVVCVLIMIAGGLVLRRGGRLSAGTTEGIESDTAQRIIEEKLAYPGDSSFVILFRAHELTPTDPRFTDGIRAALAPLRADPRVRAILAPDDAPPLVAERLVSAPARSALAVVTLQRRVLRRRRGISGAPRDGALAGSSTSASPAISPFATTSTRPSSRDLLFAELLSLPLAMLVLLVVFRTVGRGGALGRRRRPRGDHRRRRRHGAVARHGHRRLRHQRRLARSGSASRSTTRSSSSAATATSSPAAPATREALVTALDTGGPRRRVLRLRGRDRPRQPALLPRLVPRRHGTGRRHRRRALDRRRPHLPAGPAGAARTAHRRRAPAAAAPDRHSTACGIASRPG